ncbi:MAG TPA: hypothetical protein VLA12_19040, partial [Planctomycetaceae bacterium]|nr:hypothetical protein [Planctomycetaceae bacterium]
GQFTVATVTIQITGQNDAPIIETLISPDANEANVITIKGTFEDLDRALGAGEDVHALSVSVTAPIDHPFEVVPGSTIIVFNAVTGKYNFSVDVIFHDDNPTGSPSDLVTLEFEIDDQIVTATGEREVTVNNLPPSIIDYEADVQLSTLGELVIPITLSDPSALDTLTLSVNRVAENDDIFETAVANSNDPGDLVVWNPSAMDPRKGELIVRYDANDFDGLSFTLRIIATDDDTGESSIIRVNATVPAGLGFLPVTPEPEDPTAPAPLPFSLPPIPESTNTISLPDNVQRALAPPAKGETVALELRIVWNYGEPHEWQEKIRELIAKDRKELQEKLQELSELLQGLPDNQYRAFLVRGDGTENQLMEVRIREGKIVDLNQQEESSYTPGASEVSTEPTAPEQIPGEPMSRLERAFPSRNSERPHDMKQTAADPFARFGRGSQIEAWQSVYRARVATAIDN